MEKTLLLKTDNFHNPWTWIIRAVQLAIAMIVLYLVDIKEQESSTNVLFLGYSLISVLVIYFILAPTDEIELDECTISFKRKSLLPVFNRSTSYEISKIKGIGSYFQSKVAGLTALLIPVMNANTVEIIFSDNSSISFDVIASKKELQPILLEVRKRVDKLK